MTITLSPALEAIIAEKINSGEYESAEQVVSTGVGLLYRLSPDERDTLRRLQADVADARQSVANGDVAPLDMKAIVAKAQRIHDVEQSR